MCSLIYLFVLVDDSLVGFHVVIFFYPKYSKIFPGFRLPSLWYGELVFYDPFAEPIQIFLLGFSQGMN